VVIEVTDATTLAATARQICDDHDRMTQIALRRGPIAAQTGKRPEFAADSCLELIDRTGSAS
jgi:hypothetical protein